MVDVVTGMKSFWTLSMAGLAFGNQHRISSTRSSATARTRRSGNMNPKRVQKVIADFKATFGNDVKTADPNVTPSLDHDEQVHRPEHRTR